jgi:hypothetical protein
MKKLIDKIHMATTKKLGRPKYIPSKEHLNAVYLLAKKGLNHEEIANTLKIHRDTFRRNLNTIIKNNEYDFTTFNSAIKKGRGESDPIRLEQAKNAFFERVIGFDHDEVHKEEIIDGMGLKTTKNKTIKKKVLADITAGMFWLVNKSGGEFRSINQPNVQSGENVDEYYSKIADALVQLDNNTEKVQE